MKQSDMIHNKQKFEIGKLKIEANWAKAEIPCKRIKFTIGKEQALIKKDDLYALLMLYANDKQMMDAVDIKEMKKITKMMKVVCEKDFKKGDEIVFPVQYETTPEIFNIWEKENKKKMKSLEEAKTQLTS